MLVPLSWLLEYVALAEPADAGEVARRLTAVGLEIEGVEQVGHDISGVVVARRTHPRRPRVAHGTADQLSGVGRTDQPP